MRDEQLEPSPAPSEQWVGWCCSCCGAPLVPRGRGLLCRVEQRWFATRDGVHLLLPEERRQTIHAFREIRRRVPRVPARSLREEEERSRCLAEGLALAGDALGPGPWDTLVVGGEPGRQLIEGGHRLAVVDSGLEPGGGLAPAPEPFPRAEAELDALPLEPGRFDLVWAAGSLHCGRSLSRSLVELRRVTRRGGALVAFDSPVFRKRADGEAQVSRAMKEERALVGMAVPREARPGYLVRDELPEQFQGAGWSLRLLGWPRAVRELGEDVLRRLRGKGPDGRYPVLFATRDG